IGLPGRGLANFWGELTVFVALWNFERWMVVPAVFGVVISAIFALRAMANIFFGQPTEAFAHRVELSGIGDLTRCEKLPVILLLAILIFVGVWPKSISEPINRSLLVIYPAVEQQVEEAAQAASLD